MFYNANKFEFPTKIKNIAVEIWTEVTWSPETVGRGWWRFGAWAPETFMSLDGGLLPKVESFFVHYSQFFLQLHT